MQVEPGPIGAVMSAIRACLDPWLGEPRWKQGEGRVTFVYRFQSEGHPVTPLRLKVEINTREQFSVLGLRRRTFQVDSPWFAGRCGVLTYEPEELLATKLRALYQRKKGRDLFDLSVALEQVEGLDPARVIECFLRYLEPEGAVITRAGFERNLSAKLSDAVFLGDTAPLLAAGRTHDPGTAFERVRTSFLSRLAGEPANKRRSRQR